MSFIHGEVSMQRGDSGDFSDVTLNTPLVADDKVSTGDDSRTELELDHADVLRLDSNSDAHIVTLTRSQIRVQLGEGLANYSIMNGAEADVVIEAPNVAVHPLREGRYRIQVIGDSDAEVTVRDGEAEISTDEGNTHVKNGQVITVHGTGQDAEYKIADAPSADDWDQWNRDRDNTIENARSYQETNRYYTGAHDLDGYGVWSEVPDYGPVWVPRVSAGWAPYRAGRWVYEPYYGWTWVSAEPWGWAPYHYGRWFIYNNSWCWWPGPVYGGYRPIWAPAYVSFFGFGRGSGISLGVSFGGGFGSIGWLPIGPGDYFHPWWGGYRQRYNVIDIHNVYNIHGGIRPLYRSDRFSNLRNVFTNDRLRGGVSGVPVGNFGRGFGRANQVSISELHSGRVIAGNLPINPTRESRRVSDRPVGSWAAARVNRDQRFFSNPRSAQAQQGGASNRFGGRSQDIQQGYGARGGAVPSGRSDQSFAGARNNGWQRFSRPGVAANDRGNSGTANSRYRSQSGSYRPPLDISKPIVNERGGGESSTAAITPLMQAGEPAAEIRHFHQPPSLPPGAGRRECAGQPQRAFAGCAR